MGDLDVVAVAREQPVPDQCLDDHAVPGRRVTGRVDLVHRHPASPDRTLVVLVGQPHQHLPGGLASLLVEAGVHLLRRGGDRTGHPARLEVSGQGEQVSATPLPGPDQRGGEQRQRPGAAQHVAQYGVDQVGLHGQAGRGGGTLDHLAYLGVAQRWNQRQGTDQPVGHRGVLRETTDVVAPHHEHAAGHVVVIEQPEQRVQECRPLGRIDGGRPDLLQLVAHQEPRRCALVPVAAASRPGRPPGGSQG